MASQPSGASGAAPNGQTPSNAGAAPGGGGTADFIGALISLISRSDIRYQGFLAQIDAGQATIALEKVRSWGTEGRFVQQGRPHDEIPPNDNIYDYIVFRAADVKDLKIDDPHPDRSRPPPPPQSSSLQDPAILGSSGPPAPFGGPFGPGPAFGMPPPGPFGPGPGSFTPGFGPGPPRPHFPGGPPGMPPQYPQGQQGPKPTSQQMQPKDEPSPQRPAEAGEHQEAQISSPAVSRGTKPADKTTSDIKKEEPDTVIDHLSKLNVSGSANVPPTPVSKAQQGSAPAGANLPAIPHAAAAAAVTSPRSQGGSRGGRQVPGAGGRQQRSSVFDQPHHAVDVPDADFDFAAANAKFEKTKNTKESGGSGEGETGTEEAVPAVTGNESELAIDSFSPPVDITSFYDKSSGFFDNISSEVRDRYEGSGEGVVPEGGRGGSQGARGGGRGGARANRMAEERRNMATFGEAGNNYGGGFGGRGRGRGRGRARGRGRGGYRGGRGGLVSS